MAVPAAFLVAQKLKTSLALAYLLAGVVAGPLGFGLLMPNELLSGVGQFGLLLFLFSVGLEIPLHRIVSLRRYIFGLGLLQVLITSLALFGLASLFLPVGPAVILALAASLSSTAVVVQVLSERHEMTSISGRVALSILLFQDLIAIILFVVLGLIKNPTMSLGGVVGIGSLGAVLTLLGGVVLCQLTERYLGRYGNSDYVTSFVLVAVLGLSWVSEACYLSSELGAFVAGIAMASTAWRHKISVDLNAFRSLFLALFFIVLGLELESWPEWHRLIMVVGGVVIVGLIKTGVLAVCARGYRLPSSWSFGLLLGGCSEFVFMVIPQLSQWIPHPFRNELLLGTLLSMVVSPMLFLLVKNRTQRHDRAERHRGGQTGGEKPTIMIAGFGHVGETIAQLLAQNFISFAVIDYDQEAVERARHEGYKAYEGDIRDIDFLKSIKVYEAKALLFTFGHLRSTVEVVRLIRTKFPHVFVAVQVRDFQDTVSYAGLGANLVIPEPVASGIQMASLAFQSLGFSKDYVEKMTSYVAQPLLFSPSVSHNDD